MKPRMPTQPRQLPVYREVPTWFQSCLIRWSEGHYSCSENIWCPSDDRLILKDPSQDYQKCARWASVPSSRPRMLYGRRPSDALSRNVKWYESGGWFRLRWWSYPFLRLDTGAPVGLLGSYPQVFSTPKLIPRPVKIFSHGSPGSAGQKPVGYGYSQVNHRL